jgi:hypothetical protein
MPQQKTKSLQLPLAAKGFGSLASKEQRDLKNDNLRHPCQTRLKQSAAHCGKRERLTLFAGSLSPIPFNKKAPANMSRRLFKILKNS